MVPVSVFATSSNVTIQLKAAERCFPNIKNDRGGKEEVFVLKKAVLTLESVDRVLSSETFQMNASE